MKKPYPAAFHGFTGAAIVPVVPAKPRVIVRRGRARNPLKLPPTETPLIVTARHTVGAVIQPDELKPWQDIDEDDEIQ